MSKIYHKHRELYSHRRGGLRNAEEVPLFVGLLALNFAAVGKKFG